ncbi:MAG: TetR/AcrR family transcriptional regulator [Bacteroidota bacterium]
MKSSAVRSNIIETASELFYKKGFNSTGINEVIKEAGVAKATLYSHFSSKDELCLAYLQHRHAAFIEGIEKAALAVVADGSQLLALFDFLEDFYHTKDFTGCWAQRTISELPTVDGAVRKEVLSQKQQLVRLIERLVANNRPKLALEARQALARQIYLLYEGAVSESYLQADSWPIGAAKNICKTLLA